MGIHGKKKEKNKETTVTKTWLQAKVTFIQISKTKRHKMIPKQRNWEARSNLVSVGHQDIPKNSNMP